jgi:hypothetical protein
MQSEKEKLKNENEKKKCYCSHNHNTPSLLVYLVVIYTSYPLGMNHHIC